MIDSADYSLVVMAKFECGRDKYRWLNGVIAVGPVEHTDAGPVYSIYEIG